MSETPAPDAGTAEAVVHAAGILARSKLVALGPGELVTLRPERSEPVGVTYAVTRITLAERDWLVAFCLSAADRRDKEAP